MWWIRVDVSAFILIESLPLHWLVLSGNITNMDAAWVSGVCEMKCIEIYNSLQFPAEVNTSSSKTPATFIHFHTDYDYRSRLSINKDLFLHIFSAKTMLWPLHTFSIVYNSLKQYHTLKGLFTFKETCCLIMFFVDGSWSENTNKWTTRLHVRNRKFG